MTTLRIPAILALSLALPQLVPAAVPGTINYQGRLTLAVFRIF